MRGKSKSNEIEILERRKQVVNLYLKGVTQWEISLRLGLSSIVVSNDIAAVRQSWLESSLRDFNEAKANELAKIDKLESIAWGAWERSCCDKEVKREEKVKGRVSKRGSYLPDLVRNSKSYHGQSGNPKFLERVAWCIQTRLKIFGILDNDKPNINNVIRIDWSNIAERRLVKESIEDELAKAIEDLSNSKSYCDIEASVQIPYSVDNEMNREVNNV